MSRMRVRPHAPGTSAHTLESVWCRRVSRKSATVDQSRILLGTLKAILKGEREPLPSEIAPGVRKRAQS